jgi:hypothetical protein
MSDSDALAEMLALSAARTELAMGEQGIRSTLSVGDGFKRLTTAPENRYLLEFSPQNAKQDGSYHRLKVTIDRKGLKLKARAGYFAENPAKK